MPDYEARIKTKYGELTIHFADKPDLEKKLEQVPEFATTIEKSIGSILLKEPEKVIPGLEGIYAIQSDGTIKLLKIPEQNAELLRLAAFLSSGPLKPAQMREITGIDDPVSHMSSGDFIKNSDGSYTLSAPGRAQVSSKTIPSLKSKEKPAEKPA
nr:hypothetical protein [Candidatus Njordarchaeota archaeon]